MTTFETTEATSSLQKRAHKMVLEAEDALGKYEEGFEDWIDDWKKLKSDVKRAKK